MKNSIKLFSLCVVMIFVFTGISMAKSKQISNIQKSNNKLPSKKPCFSKLGNKLNELGDFEFGGKCDSAKEAASSAQTNSRGVCDKLGGTDSLCTSARDAEDKAQKAYEDCLSNQQTRTDAVVKVINAAAGVIKSIGEGLVKITINTTTTETKTTPTTPKALPPDTPANPIDNPFEIDFSDIIE